MSSGHAKAAHPPASAGATATPAAPAASSTGNPVIKQPTFLGGLSAIVMILFVVFVGIGLAYQLRWFGWGRPATPEEIEAEQAARATAIAARVKAAAEEAARRQTAPPDGPAVAKSGSNVPDVPRAISNVLSGIPQMLLGLTEKQGPPRPPGKVYELWVRPGVIVWEGKISRSQPSPWFEAKETVFAFIDTDGEGVQRKEFFPGNPHIFRWVEDESDEPLTAAAFGEQVP